MSGPWLGRAKLGARSRDAEQHDFAARDRLHGPLTDLVSNVNQLRRGVAELHGGEAAAVAGDGRSEHDRLERLHDDLVVRPALAGHSIWIRRRRTIRREQIVV